MRGDEQGRTFWEEETAYTNATGKRKHVSVSSWPGLVWLELRRAGQWMRQWTGHVYPPELKWLRGEHKTWK